MCQKNPETPVVIDHFARIGVDGVIRDKHLKQLCNLAKHKNTYVKISADSLRALVVELLLAKQVFRFDAETAADRMVEADLRGIQSHGSRALVRYLKAIDVADIDPRGHVLTVQETPAMAVLDGSRSIGHVAATKAMQLAISKAREVGTGTVAVRNSQHLGAASVYAMLAALEGQIGYCITSTGGATVAAYGSRQSAVANNAFAPKVTLPPSPVSMMTSLSMTTRSPSSTSPPLFA